MTKVNTINLKGKAYAQVKDRLKVFWEDNPNGTIDTNTTPLPDGSVIVKSTVCRNANERGGCATGQAHGKLDGEKAFEKLESVANGRALANLGYLANGEIASLEEMQEFLDHKEELKVEKVNQAIKELKKCKSLSTLKKTWAEIDAETQRNEQVLGLKDSLKLELV